MISVANGIHLSNCFMVYVISSSLVLIPFMRFKLLISMAPINYTSLLTKLKADLSGSEVELKKRGHFSNTFFFPQRHRIACWMFAVMKISRIRQLLIPSRKPTHLSLNMQTTKKHSKTYMAHNHVHVNTPSSVLISNYLHHDPHSTNDMLAS